MSAELNAYGGCDTEGKGSGRIGCDKSNWGDLKGFVLVRKGSFWTVTALVAAITKQLWLDGIDGLKLFPYVGANDYDSTPGATEINTSTIQVKREVRSGLPEISFMYIDGNCRHASLWDKKGFKRWDVVLLYANGMRMAHNFDLSKVKGFDAGMFTVDTETIQKGTDLQMSKCTFQLLDADEFAVRNAFFTWDELGFDAREYEGFNDIYVRLNPITPGDTATAKITASCNSSVQISTLDDPDNWKLIGPLAATNEISAVVYDPDTGLTEFTFDDPLIATNVVQIQTKRLAFAVAADISDQRYKGTSNQVTVA